MSAEWTPLPVVELALSSLIIWCFWPSLEWWRMTDVRLFLSPILLVVFPLPLFSLQAVQSPIHTMYIRSSKKKYEYMSRADLLFPIGFVGMTEMLESGCISNLCWPFLALLIYFDLSLI
jgi:hypothetical protein